MAKKVKERPTKPEHDLRITEATLEALVKAVVKGKPQPEPKRGDESAS